VHEMTKKFLEEAFAGESMAHMKYMIFAEDAEQKGLTKLQICGKLSLMQSLCMQRIILRH